MKPLARLDWLRVVASTPGMIGPPLAVAVALTKYINNDTHDARPSIASLAAQIGLAERTVQKAARTLEASGLLTVDHPAGRKCCTYTPANPVPPDRVQPRPTGQGSAPANPVPSGRQPRPVRSPTPSSRSPEQGGTGYEQGGRALRAARSQMDDGMRGDEADSVGPMFLLRDGTAWRLSKGLHTTLAAAFPGIDLDGELAQAAAWCATNSSRRKKANGMPRFLNGWLGKAMAKSRDRASPRVPDGGVESGMPTPDAGAWDAAAQVEREIHGT